MSCGMVIRPHYKFQIKATHLQQTQVKHITNQSLVFIKWHIYLLCDIPKPMIFRFLPYIHHSDLFCGWVPVQSFTSPKPRLHPLPILSIEEMKVLAQVIHKWSWQLPRWKVQFHLPMWFLLLVLGHFQRLCLGNYYLSKGRWAIIEVLSRFVPLTRKKKGSLVHGASIKISHVTWVFFRTSANIQQALWFRHLIAVVPLCKHSYATHSSVFRNPMETEASG